MHKLKKIIISLTLAFLLLFSFSLSVFAVHSSGGGSSDEVKQWTEDFSNSDTKGYSYVYNSTYIATSTLMKGETYVNSWGYEYFDDDYVIEIADISRDSDGNITALYFRKPTQHYKYIRACEYINIGSCTVYHYLNCNDDLFDTLYSVYSTSVHGIHIDWSHISIVDGLVEAGETFDYYDYFGNPKSVTFSGNGGIMGGGSASRYPDEVTEEPSLDDYLPDFNDSKYNPADLSSYLPAPPDSLDILDWLKYFIDCVKAFFNWAVDTFKAKILLLYDTITSLFNFLKDYLTYFLDKLKHGLFDLFVPSDDFAQSAIDKFSQVELSSTFLNSTVAPVVQALEQTTDRSPKKYEFTAFGADCSFDFSSLQFIIPVTDAIIIFFSYFFGLKHLVFSFLNLFSTIKKEGD